MKKVCEKEVCGFTERTEALGKQCGSDVLSLTGAKDLASVSPHIEKISAIGERSMLDERGDTVPRII